MNVVGSRRKGTWTGLSSRLIEALSVAAPMTLILCVSLFVRLWRINAFGYNSDEAVYVGQGGALAGISSIEEFFPAFRAHPLLVQFLISFVLMVTSDDVYPRLVAVGFGVGTVVVVYKLGKLLYGPRAGLMAALLLAIMPYHVIVTRQILLDGPMTFFTTLCLYFLARSADSKRMAWFYGAAAAMGLAFLAKETAVVMLGAVYLFYAMSPSLRVTVKDLALFMAIFILVILPFPVSIILSGRLDGGTDFLAWQLFRRPNHDWTFYALNVPEAIGPLLCLAALGGFLYARRARSWAEVLLASWIVVPVVFFQLWQVKGYQYLLPITPAVAILGARALEVWLSGGTAEKAWKFTLGVVAAGLVVGSMALATGSRIANSDQYTGLAGSGGLPAAREAGLWIAANTPEGSTFMTIGPSMANLVQFYGERRALGLAVSPNPLRRNPSYDPIVNPDALLRAGNINYVVWDAFSANRSTVFSEKVLAYAEKYHGRVIHSETATWTLPGGKTAEMAVIVIYEVHP